MRRKPLTGKEAEMPMMTKAESDALELKRSKRLSCPKGNARVFGDRDDCPSMCTYRRPERKFELFPEYCGDCYYPRECYELVQSPDGNRCEFGRVELDDEGWLIGLPDYAEWKNKDDERKAEEVRLHEKEEAELRKQREVEAKQRELDQLLERARQSEQDTQEQANLERLRHELSQPWVPPEKESPLFYDRRTGTHYKYGSDSRRYDVDLDNDGSINC